jgi:hypothetical protein
VRVTYTGTKTLCPYSIRPDEVQPGDTFGYKIIAHVWADGNGWAAYRCYTTWDDEQGWYGGHIVDEAIARGLFPALANLSYNDC